MTSLKQCELSHIDFTTDTLWLRNVRQLHGCSHHWLGPRTERITAPSKLLNMLSHIPLLETLCGLDRCTLGPLDIIHPLPDVVLPRLSSIALKTGGNSDAIIAVLTHTNPAPGCNFYVDFCVLDSEQKRSRHFTASSLSISRTISSPNPYRTFQFTLTSAGAVSSK